MKNLVGNISILLVTLCAQITMAQEGPIEFSKTQTLASPLVEVVHVPNTDFSNPDNIKAAVQEFLKSESFVRGASEQPRVYKIVSTSDQRTPYGNTGFFIAAAASRKFKDDDKQKHIVAGGLIAGTTQHFTEMLFSESLTPAQSRLYSQIAGILTTAAVATLKEYRDGRGHGTRESKDVYATVLGSGLHFVPIRMEW